MAKAKLTGKKSKAMEKEDKVDKTKEDKVDKTKLKHTKVNKRIYF